ncbi:MAG: hypothetical protein WC291_04095, partial [Thermodesulfovibrionales bacterium]
MLNAAVDIRVVETVAAFASVVGLCLLLKHYGVVKEEHGSVFARLLTEAALPAVIFTQLSTHPILPRHISMIIII